MGKGKGKVCIGAKWPIRLELFLVSVHEVTRSISTPPWMGCWSIAGITPALNFLVPIYTLGWREALRVKCLVQEHNTVSLARAQTRTGMIRNGAH